MRHEQRIVVMIAELYASGCNETECKKYHRLLVYVDESFDTDVYEEPVLGWIVAATPQTGDGGEYVALLVYDEDSTITILDHTLGRQMIDMGQLTHPGDRVCEIVQRLRYTTRMILTPHNNEQPMSVHSRPCHRMQNSS